MSRNAPPKETAAHFRAFLSNRPRSIYQYSSMAPRLSGQNCKFFKFLLSLNSQKRLGYKENNTKYRILTRKPRSHVRILIYRTWPIVFMFCLRSVEQTNRITAKCEWRKLSREKSGCDRQSIANVLIMVHETPKKIVLSVSRVNCYALLMKES